MTPPAPEVESLLIRLDAETDQDPVLDLESQFGNRHPVELELGIGKGRFLLDAALHHPEVNYIGVEHAAKYLRLAHARALRRGCTNLRFVHGDAREFVEFFLASASVRAIHVYFPDPWPKKRHHKRRLLDEAFLAEVERVLQPGGRLWLATDHDGYFESILEILDRFRDLLAPVEAVWEGVSTNYEDKFVGQGRAIHRRVLERS